MSTPAAALARRACKGWRWMPGMAVVYIWGGQARDRYLCTDKSGVNLVVEDPGSTEAGPMTWIRKKPESFARDCLPDLSDPATLGCLLALVREAWGDMRAWVEPASDGWIVEVGSGYSFHGATGAEALVAALEAAPS